MDFICDKCHRTFTRQCDLTKHKNTCGKIFLFEGYLAYLGPDGRERFIHRDVLEEKIGRPLESHENGHHKDENKLNNDPDNLEVLTISEHSKHHWKDRDITNHLENRKKISKGLLANLHNSKSVKLREEQVLEIRRRLDNKETQNSLAVEYGVSPYTIKDIRGRKTWKHI